MNAGSAKKPWLRSALTALVTSRYMRLKQARPSLAGSAAPIASIRATASATDVTGCAGIGGPSGMRVTIRSGPRGYRRAPRSHAGVLDLGSPARAVRPGAVMGDGEAGGGHPAGGWGGPGLIPQGLRELRVDGEVRTGLIAVGHRPVVGDHGNHLPVLRQHLHDHDGGAALLRAGEEAPHQRGADAHAPAAIRDHYADLGPAAAGVTGGVTGHRMADDHAVLGGHQCVAAPGPARQDAQHRPAGGRGAGEKPQVANPWRQAGKEFPQRWVIGAARLAYFKINTCGRGYLSSAHEPRIRHGC